MKVLFLVNQYPPFLTSAARLYAELAQDLKAAGHEVTVLTHLPPNGAAATDDAGIRVIRLPPSPFPRAVLFLRAIEQFVTAAQYAFAALKLERQDVVLVYSPPLPLGLAAWPLARAWGARWVLNAQDLYPKTAVDLGLLRNRFAIRLAEVIEQLEYATADAVTVHSEGNRRYVMDHGVRAERAHSIYNWVDHRDFASLERDAARKRLAEYGFANRFVVFYGGAMGFAQALGDIVSAAEVLKNDPRIQFVLVGDGIMREPMEKRAKEAGLTNVSFFAKVPLDVYNALTAAADVCLVTLKAELVSPVVPGKLQTIMAAGRPVIVSTHPVSDAKAIVEEAGCGLFVHAGRPAELAAAITKLANEPSLLPEMGARGKAFAQKHFDRASCTAAYERLFKNLNRSELHP